MKKRYELDDFETFESSLNTKLVDENTQDVSFERKVLPTEENIELPNEEEIDPMHNTISDLLASRANERRQKMKDFNYKFNNAKIDEIEKEPAYKRKGVNIENTKHSTETPDVSRLSVGNERQ